MYCVEQDYETGQAIPVTGGQVMLKGYNIRINI